MKPTTLTAFQEAITKKDLIAVCKQLHFTLTDEQLSQLKYYYKFTWVVVQFRVKGYGYISFAIDNHNQHTLFGPKITVLDIQEALNKNAIQFKVWRFVDDEIKKREDQALPFVQGHYDSPSPVEFYHHYYKE